MRTAREHPRSPGVWLVQITLAILVLLSGNTASASNLTTATLNGAVVDGSGSAIAGATVNIVHTPSGSRKTAVSNAEGAFFRSGLRVGGPYTISVSAPGFEQRTLEDLYFSPGTQPLLRIAVQGQGSSAIEEVYVTASEIASDISNGVGSDFSYEDVSNQPATRRDVIRTLIRDPLANSDEEGILSVAGANPRFNGLAIDGALQQDDFGLGSNTYATARSPINIDAIESASVVASDYSVVISGFTGGLVNVTTKSGTNEFDGSLFYYYQDEDYLGDSFGGGEDFNPAPFEEEEYGVTLGGPIVKDKLFFFVSYDEYDSSENVDFRNSDNDNGIQPGFFDALRQLTIDTYNFDPGSRPLTASTPATSERLLTKFDWNINDNNRASFTYQSSEETGTSVGADRLESAWYDTPVDLEAYTVQLFSDWTPELSTTLRLNYKEFERGQICAGGPDIGVLELLDIDPADTVGTPLEGLITVPGEDLFFGCDRFRHANEYNDERLQLFASADYQVGDHLLTFGGEYEDFELFNLFVPSSRGRFRFDSVQDFINNQNVRVDYLNVNSNNVREGAAEWGYEKTSLFLQDTWQVRDDLELTLGLRYERYSQGDQPAFSNVVQDRFGVNSSANLDGADLWLPRIGFRWDAASTTTVSGGFGLFAGGEPRVWISNAFQVPAVFTTSRFDNIDPFTIPNDLLTNVANGTPLPIDSIAEDFNIPSDWKASLRVDHDFDAKFSGFDLGRDFRFTAQYLYTRAQDSFMWANLAQTELAEVLPTGVAPDGRPIYADLDALGIPNQTQLRNADGQESHTFSVSLSKRWSNGLDMQLSYAFQDIEILSEGTSSRGISNWRGLTALDRNNPEARVSPFQIEHAFKVSLGYEREFFRGLRTRIDVFGQLYSEGQFTGTFDVSPSNSLFGRAGLGEAPFDNSPLYVPNGANDPNVVFADGFDQAAFFAYVSSNDIGPGLAGVNESGELWNNIWDLRFQQELPGIPGLDRVFGENRFKLQIDIENFLNLLNDDWGNFNEGPRNGQAGIVRADLISAADLAANGVGGASALLGDAPRTTCLSAGDCVYRFNSFRNVEAGRTDPERSVYRIRIGLRMEF